MVANITARFPTCVDQIESKNSIVLGGIDNIIQHKAGTNDFPGSTNYGWANTIIGGNLNRISGSMSGSAQHADDYDKMMGG